jgi:ketosteroid isomerase-like protein
MSNSNTPAFESSPAADPSTQTIIDFVARYTSAWFRPKADNVADLMHEDTRNLIPPMTEAGDRATVLAHFNEVLKKIPDLSLVVQRWAHAGDSVMIEWRASASVAGTALTWSGVDIVRLRGERMSELQSYWDTQALNQQVQAALQTGGPSADCASPEMA